MYNARDAYTRVYAYIGILCRVVVNDIEKVNEINDFRIDNTFQTTLKT